jgi:hypothetical protein
MNTLTFTLTVFGLFTNIYSHPVMMLNEEFLNLADAQNAIMIHTVEHGESYKVFKSDPRCYVVICQEPHCTFRIRASALKKCVRITVYSEHICSPITHNAFCTSHSFAYLLDHHRESIAANRELTLKQIQTNERLQYGNRISYMQAYRVREAARLEIEGNETGSFNKFPSLIMAVNNSDEENWVTIELLGDQFNRAFVAPAATRYVFIKCHPFLALDGTHTKSRFRMTLLIACVLDGNNEILPIA